jgi:hypothetical protein
MLADEAETKNWIISHLLAHWKLFSWRWGVYSNYTIVTTTALDKSKWSVLCHQCDFLEVALRED